MIDEKFVGVLTLSILFKPRSITGALCGIGHDMPAELYQDMYAALFKSHLAYEISLRGLALKDKSNDNIFIA